MTNLDSVIRNEYVRFDTPADQIIANVHVSEQFRDNVNSQLASAEQVDLSTLNRRLLNLRKRGGDKGGLPRLRHLR